MIFNILKYIIFGLVQGFTEPLPISSSGHLVLFRYLFNTNAFDDLSFEVLLNFASFIAIAFLFRKDIIDLVKSFINYILHKEKRNDAKLKEGFKYCLLVIIGCIPAGLAGIFLDDFIEDKLGNIKILGIAFIVTAILLFLVKNINGNKKDKDITVKDAIVIGLFQMIALFPGISRSGATLVGCFLCKLDKNTALKYTFMLYLPVSLGSLLLSITDLIKVDISLLIPYIIGFIVSGITTYFASKWFFNIVRNGKLVRFSVYLVLLGIAIILFL